MVPLLRGDEINPPPQGDELMGPHLLGDGKYLVGSTPPVCMSHHHHKSRHLYPLHDGCGGRLQPVGVAHRQVPLLIDTSGGGGAHREAHPLSDSPGGGRVHPQAPLLSDAPREGGAHQRAPPLRNESREGGAHQPVTPLSDGPGEGGVHPQAPPLIAASLERYTVPSKSPREGAAPLPLAEHRPLHLEEWTGVWAPHSGGCEHPLPLHLARTIHHRAAARAAGPPPRTIPTPPRVRTCPNPLRLNAGRESPGRHHSPLTAVIQTLTPTAPPPSDSVDVTPLLLPGGLLAEGPAPTAPPLSDNGLSGDATPLPLPGGGLPAEGPAPHTAGSKPAPPLATPPPPLMCGTAAGPPPLDGADAHAGVTTPLPQHVATGRQRG